MLDIISIAGLVCAIVIAWQDARQRRIHLFWLGGFVLLGLLLKALSSNSNWEGLLANLLIVGIIVGTVWGWFRLKGNDTVMDVMLCWGDVIMLVGLGVWLDPFTFIICFVIATILPLVVYGFLRIKKKINADYPIPFATWCSVVFLVIYPLSYWLGFSFETWMYA